MDCEDEGDIEGKIKNFNFFRLFSPFFPLWSTTTKTQFLVLFGTFLRTSKLH